MPLKEIAKILDNAALEAMPTAQVSIDTPISLEDAYTIQKFSIERRLNRGENLTGYKLGFTSKAKMEQMGVHELIWGRLTDQMDLTSEKALSLHSFIHPRVEPEIAFIVKKDIEGPINREEVFEYVSAIAPALEIIDSRYKDFKFSLEDVIADNCSSSGYVLGELLPPDTNISDVSIKLSISNALIHSGNTNAILGDPWESFLEATRITSKYGVPILKDMVVLAGAATPAEYLKTNDVVECEFQGLGKVTLAVEE
jgi:2-oxo-3-hexenedioate decarboxylase